MIEEDKIKVTSTDLESGEPIVHRDLESGDLESGEEVALPATPSVTLDHKAIRDVVDKESVEIVNNIVVSKDDKELSEYIAKFNLNMSKKNLLRILRMNELQDLVCDEAIDRVENHPDELTHAELINYIKTTQDALNNAKKGADYSETVAPITVNQQNNTVNVNVTNDEGMDRRSKERIMQAVKKLLNILDDNNAEQAEIIENSNEGEK